MLIGVNGYEANIENRVGVNMYAFELLWAMYNADKDDNSYVIYLKNSPKNDLPPERENWKYKILSGGPVWILSRLMPHLFLTSERPDVFFSPGHYIPPVAPMPQVCSIMDLGYLEFSDHLKFYDYWQLKLWSAWSMLVAKYILAISLSTKQEIVRHYPFAKDKVTVTPLAYGRKKFNKDISIEDVSTTKKKYAIDAEYVLFISTLKPSKNVNGLVDAWKNAVNRFPQYKLVIAGKKGWLYDDIFRKTREEKLEKSIIFTGYVDEEDKPSLIKGAKVLVLPSFWEGFGLDPLYAMAAGVPVIVSNKGSLPEVVGDAGILVDPYTISSISDAIKKVLSMDEVEYNKLVAKGLVQAAKFSWEETARKTIEVLEETGQK